MVNQMEAAETHKDDIEMHREEKAKLTAELEEIKTMLNNGMKQIIHYIISIYQHIFCYFVSSLSSLGEAIVSTVGISTVFIEG